MKKHSYNHGRHEDMISAATEIKLDTSKLKISEDDGEKTESPLLYLQKQIAKHNKISTS